MGKIRNAKPKKINDFKKVKAKVGKQIARGPTTVINVKTKRIMLLTQVNASVEPVIEESARITQLLRQFHHHSVSHRISAVEDMNQLLSKSESPETHVALVLPSILELLFDEDKESRQNLLKLIKNLLEKCPHRETYETIAPIITTYACSGLTSLTKGIRLDALHLLNMFLSNEAVRPIFQPDVDKLLNQVHHVLAAPSQINTAVTFTVATKLPSATAVPTKKNSKDHKKDNVQSLFHTSYILTAILVLSNLLLLLKSSLDLNALDSYEGGIDQHSTFSSNDNSVFAGNRHSQEAILLQRSFRRELLSGSRSNHVSLESQAIRLELLKSIELTISSYWNLTVSNPPLVSTSAHNESYQIASSLALISIPLSAILMSYLTSTSISSMNLVSILSHHFHLYENLFKSFPYQSEEGSIAPTGSTLELESKKRIDTLNMILCESSFIAYLRYLSFQSDMKMDTMNPTHGDMTNIINLSSSYLSNSVDLFSQKIRRQLNYFTGNTKQIVGKKISLNLENEPLEVEVGESGQDQEDEGGQKRNNQTLSESLLRLFRCVSYQSRYMIRCKHAGNFTNQLTQLLNQFSMLLNQFLLSLDYFDRTHSQGRKSTNSKEVLQLLYSIEKILESTSRMISLDELWDFVNPEDSTIVYLEARNQSLLTLLENICKIPKSVSSWLKTPSSSSTSSLPSPQDNQEIFHSILRQVCNILLVIITRGTTTGEDSSSGNFTRWRQHLNQLICNTILELFEENDLPNSQSIYRKCQSNYRHTWFDIWNFCQFEPNLKNEVLLNITEQLCLPKITLQEQSYFLSLLYLKRFDYSPNDLVSILMNSFDCHKDSHVNHSSSSSASSSSFPTSLQLFQQWCQLVAHFFYLCSSSSNSLSLVSFILPHLQLLTSSSFENLNSDNQLDLNLLPTSYFNSYLISSLFSSLIRNYQLSSSSSTRLSSPPVISWSSSPSLSNNSHQQTLSEFLEIFVNSLATYLTDISSSSSSILQSGWVNLKHGGLVSGTQEEEEEGQAPVSNHWLLASIQTKWKLYPAKEGSEGEGEGEKEDEKNVVDIWDELLKKLHQHILIWDESLQHHNSDNNNNNKSLEETVTKRCLYLLNNLFEIVQYWKTTNQLTTQKIQSLLNFFSGLQNNSVHNNSHNHHQSPATLPSASHVVKSVQVKEFINDVIQYLQ